MAYGKTDVRAMRDDNRSRLEHEYLLAEGSNLLRFLPPAKPGAFYFKYFYHYLPGNIFEICPKHTWRESCPICALGDNLFRSSDPEEMAQGRTLYRKVGYIANVIDVRNPESGIQLVRFGKQVRDQLVAFFADPDDPKDQGIDITDPETGSTVKITKTPKDESGFPKYLTTVGAAGPVPYKQWEKELLPLADIIKGITKPKEALAKLIRDVAERDDTPGPNLGKQQQAALDDEPLPSAKAARRANGLDFDDEPLPTRGKRLLPEEIDDTAQQSPTSTSKRKFIQEDDDEF